MNWFIFLIPLVYLWYRVFDSVHLEWSTNAQYSYGWIVPILSVGLIFNKWNSRPTTPIGSDVVSRRIAFTVLAFAMLLFLPARLIAGATPEWRPLQWVLALVAVTTTLILIRLAWGRNAIRMLAFPVCFFLVAIPWPSPIEQPIIQNLTASNAAFVVEVMGALGVPAVQHGNVIEVGTGIVGIDEACSGIRSFQSSIMISLFLGEYYRLGWLRRGVLFGASIILSFIFNVCRTSFLTWVAAKKGIAAIGQYHDPAGLAILVACTVSLWLVGVLLGRQPRSPQAKDGISVDPASANLQPASPILTTPTASILPLCLVLTGWLAAVEIGTNIWFASRESKLVTGPEWKMNFPVNDPTFQSSKIPETTYGLLRYDEGKEGQWTDSSNFIWHSFYFSWSPGRVAGYLAKRHTPEICMNAAGQALRDGPNLFIAKVHNISLPIRQYLFETQNNKLHVFHCRWEAGANETAFVEHESARMNLIRGIWAGRGKHGQKVFEIILSGCDTPEQARAALLKHLDSMIQVETNKAVASN